VCYPIDSISYESALTSLVSLEGGLAGRLCCRGRLPLIEMLVDPG
jgi:hypothetical protein